jgi:rsbT antagonist protein RsbS
LKLGNVLVISLQDLGDEQALELQQNVLGQLAETGAGGLLIDVSGIDVVDSFLGRVIGDTATMARLMGAHTVLAGLQPSVAITITELGLSLPGVQTALNLEKGLAMLTASEA